MKKYRPLEKNEIVRAGDEYDACNDGWRDPAEWREVRPNMIGAVQSDPQYVSHMQFRRPVSGNMELCNTLQNATAHRESGDAGGCASQGGAS